MCSFWLCAKFRSASQCELSKGTPGFARAIRAAGPACLDCNGNYWVPTIVVMKMDETMDEPIDCMMI